MTAARDPLLDLFVQVRLDLPDHQRFLTLVDELEVDDAETPRVLGCMVFLLIEAMKLQQDGDFTDWTPLRIAHASHWPTRDKERWVRALEAAGFLETTADGRRGIRNWTEFSGGVFPRRQKWAADKREQRAARAEDVSGTSPGRPGDVSGTSHAKVPNGQNVSGTSFRAKVVKSKDVNGVNEPDRLASARAGAHEEADDFLKSLDDDEQDPGSPNAPIPEPSRPINLPGANDPLAELSPTATAVAELPGLVAPVDPDPVVLQANDRERPANADELDDLRRHWGRSFGEIGAESAFRTLWGRFMAKYPRASARKLNGWFYSELETEQARALPPPTQPAIGALVVSAVPDDPNAEADENLRGPRAARELIAAHERQGMVVPEFLRTIAARAAS